MIRILKAINRFLFNRMLVSLGFPAPRVFALFSGGRFHWLDAGDASDNEAIGKPEGKRVFCKSILGECADGVFPLRIENGKFHSQGELINVPEILNLTGGSIILQEEVIQHPDTGVALGDFKIPFFHDAIEMIRNLHLFFYGVKSIGWDIAITERGPVFIEGNDNREMSCHQRNGGTRRKTIEWFSEPWPAAAISSGILLFSRPRSPRP